MIETKREKEVYVTFCNDEVRCLGALEWRKDMAG